MLSEVTIFQATPSRGQTLPRFVPAAEAKLFQCGRVPKDPSNCAVYSSFYADNFCLVTLHVAAISQLILTLSTNSMFQYLLCLERGISKSCEWTRLCPARSTCFCICIRAPTSQWCGFCTWLCLDYINGTYSWTQSKI